ncbi:pyridoxamine 5'-phosphate oxidase family protein [Blastococcus sp. SYSU D00695]
MGALSMSTEEREAFLTALHVGVLGVERADGPPLAVPVWYVYEPGGELWFLTEPDTVKGRLLQAAMRFTLCVQTEVSPYAYVSVEGTATVTPAEPDVHVRELAHRYLDPEAAEAYVARAATGPRPIRVAMRPERWWTVDYAKAAG